MGAGRAIVSTPYAYASELLADGRGVLVPPASPVALSAALNALLDDPALRAMPSAAGPTPTAVGWSGRPSAPSIAISSRRVAAPKSRDAAPDRCGRPSVSDLRTAPSRQPAPSRGPDRRRRDHAARDRVTAGPGPRLLRRRRRPGAPGGPAPRRTAGLGGGRGERLARVPLPRRRLRRVERPLPELPLDRRLVDRRPRLRRQLRAGDARAGRHDRDRPRSRAGRRRGCSRSIGRCRRPASSTSPRAEASVVLGCAAIVRLRSGRTRRQPCSTLLATRLHDRFQRARDARLAVAGSCR